MFKDIYSRHPAFQARFKDLPCPDEILAELDDIYRLASTNLNSISSKTLRFLEARSLKLLSSLFSIWTDAADSSLQKDFLADLHLEAASLVKEDFIKFFICSQNRSRFFVPIEHLSKFSSLCSHGYLFGSLENKEAQNLILLASATVQTLLENERSGRLTRDDLSCNSGPAINSLAVLLNHYFETQGFNRLMSFYLGYDVEIGGLALEIGSDKSTWWHSNYDNPPQTLYIHRDETTRFPKAFIYLSNISEDDGPFSVFPDADTIHGAPTWVQNLIGRRIGAIGRSSYHLSYGKFSHIYHQAFGDPIFRSLFRSLPAAARYSSHYGWDLLRDDPVHDLLIQNEIPLLGDPGTFLIFDGSRVSHRALQHASSNHVSLQAIFVPRRSRIKKLLSSLRIQLKSLSER
jgi:hypothetical protein